MQWTRREEAGAKDTQQQHHSSFVPGPPWQMEKLPGQQSRHRGHSAPRRAGPKVRCPAGMAKHCSRLPGDRQPPLRCWALFLSNTLEKPMKPEVFWAQKTIYSESNIRTWRPSRVCCCHCLTCIISCKRLNNLVILLVNLINHSNWTEWNDKR